MKVLPFQKTMGLMLSLCLVSNAALAAYPPIAAPDLDTSATTVPEDTSATSAAATIATHNSQEAKKFSTISTGGIELPKTLMSMDFQDADIRDVMHIMAVKSGLNIIYGADVTGPVTVHLDQVPFDQAFQTVLTLKGLVALPMGARIIRVVGSTSLNSEQTQAATFTRIFVLKYGDATTLKTPIDAIRTAAGRKGISTVDAKTNSLIITDTLEGLKEAEDLIVALDRKPQQVDIEAKIVEVSLDKDTKLGISWAFAQRANQNYFGATTTSQGGQAAGTPGANPSTSMTGVSINTPGGVNAGGAFGTNLIDPSALQQVAFTFLHSEAAYMLQTQLSALASQNRVKVLSTPHIVATNNTDANINVVDNIPYQVSTLSNGISQTSIQFVQAGVKLTVRPTVNADRRITLKVKPEVSTAGTAPFVGAPPQINSRNADTTLILRDGETIAIGGLITEQLQKTVTGIPILMSIPIIGYLFKSTDDRKQRTELIIFITPKLATE